MRRCTEKENHIGSAVNGSFCTDRGIEIPLLLYKDNKYYLVLIEDKQGSPLALESGGPVLSLTSPLFLPLQNPLYIQPGLEMLPDKIRLQNKKAFIYSYLKRYP